MRLPFTVEQFLDLFSTYNTAIWPAQVAGYALGLAVLVLIARKSTASGPVALSVLGGMWVWMGIVYHIIFFSRINPAAWLFGAFFVAGGLLFLWSGIVRRRLSFSFKARGRAVAGAVFILYAMALYPALGYFFGHVYPRSPVFGVAPCPVVIFTFGVLLLADGKVPLYLLAVPFLWSLVGGSAAWNLGVPEDYGLLLAGLLGTALIILGNRHAQKSRV